MKEGGFFFFNRSMCHRGQADFWLPTDSITNPNFNAKELWNRKEALVPSSGLHSWAQGQDEPTAPLRETRLASLAFRCMTHNMARTPNIPLKLELC